MASSRPRGLIRRDVDARQDDLVRRFREAAKTAGRKVLGSFLFRGVGRVGQVVVLLLFFLGMWEILGSQDARGQQGIEGRPVRIRGRDPFSVLQDLQPRASKLYSTSIPALDFTWRTDLARPGGMDLSGEGANGDVTAVLLHWKRTDNLKVIVAALCRYEFIDSILIWNNNPDIALTRAMFAKLHCPASKLQIHNSPENALFLSRHLACMQAVTPYCYFQDDDWFVQPLRSLYAQFKRDPEGSVVVGTTKEMAVKYRSQWCFFQPPMHTCFTWLGTGAFTSRAHVASYLEAVSTIDMPKDELAHADNSFTTFLNNPPYVLGSNAIVEMKTGRGYSDGKRGDLRNQVYIQKGVEHFTHYLNATYSGLPATTPLPTSPVPVDTSHYREASPPPLVPHPYSHHARSPCVPSDLCFFFTNVPLLLPPDATPYPGPHRVKTLSDWENHVSNLGRAEETWSLSWGYENAVDSNPETAFRSLDVARAGDYVGLGLIRAVDPFWTPSLVLHFIIEDVELLLPSLQVEVSGDGYSWFPFPAVDLETTIVSTTSPYLEDSGDEGYAFEDLRGCTALKVIVVGAGFGGLSTAIACARQGFAVTILERSSGKTAHGDSILLGPDAVRVFNSWGIGKEMCRRSSSNNHWIFNDQAGREVHREFLGDFTERYGAQHCQGKRSQFIGVLGTEALLLGVKFRYDSEVTGFTDSQTPAVILRGGEIVRGDAVVVCDGSRSVSRALLAAPGVPPVPRRSSGYSIFRAIVNVNNGLRNDPLCSHFCDGNIRFWLGLDSHVEIWPMDDRNELAF
ncbi:hypothetical protein JCM3766R1_001350, partial [Sporobolomyces carnicolor]